MGYIHDSGMKVFIPPSLGGGSGGTWTHAMDGTNWYLNRAASSGTFYLGIPVFLPHQNSNDNKGSRLASVDIYFSIYDADMAAMSCEFNLQELPSTSVEFDPPTNPAFSYDASHNAAGERITQGNHMMTLTIGTAIWIQGDEYIRADLYGNVGAVSIFRFWGARINYTLRV